MNADVQDLLWQAKTRDQLLDMLRALCRPFGPMVKADVVCGSLAPVQVMCMIQMAEAPAAASLAGRLGAVTNGSRLVIFRYVAPADFLPF
jgi:hypothetical protein